MASSIPIFNIVSSTAALNITDTVFVSIPIGANNLQSGVSIESWFGGTCTSSAANTSTFTVRYGTAGTTADATIGTFTLTAAASGTSIPFAVSLLIIIRTSGATGTLAGSVVVSNNGTTGIMAAVGSVPAFTASNINTTLDGIMSISYKSSLATTTTTFTTAMMRVN